MDIASLIGFIGAIGMILGAMISGGGVAPFIDVPSILIVVGGTFFSVMYTCPLPVFLGSFGVMAKAFLPPVKKWISWLSACLNWRQLPVKMA